MLSCRVQQPLVGLWTSDVGRGEAGEEGVGGKVKRSEERERVRQREVCVMPLPYVKYFILQVTRIRWWPGNEGTLERSIQFYLLTGALSWLPSDGKISLSGRYFFIKATILSRIYSCRELKKNGPYSYHNEKSPFSIFTWSSLDWFHTL